MSARQVASLPSERHQRLEGADGAHALGQPGVPRELLNGGAVEELEKRVVLANDSLPPRAVGLLSIHSVFWRWPTGDHLEQKMIVTLYGGP